MLHTRGCAHCVLDTADNQTAIGNRYIHIGKENRLAFKMKGNKKNLSSAAIVAIRVDSYHGCSADSRLFGVSLGRGRFFFAFFTLFGQCEGHGAAAADGWDAVTE